MVSMVKGAAMVRDALASARSAVDKSQKKKAAAAPEIRIAARTAARTAAKAKPAKAAAKPAKAAKPASRPKAKAKGKAGKKR